MNAAEGEVQQYSYMASFPTLINVDGELTYLGVLKDNAGLVKMYYTVNVKDYGSSSAAETKTENVGFTIAVMQYADIEGNTWVYMGTADGTVYKAKFADNEMLSKFADNEMLLYAKTGDVLRGTILDGKVTVKEVKRQKQNRGRGCPVPVHPSPFGARSRSSGSLSGDG